MQTRLLLASFLLIHVSLAWQKSDKTPQEEQRQTMKVPDYKNWVLQKSTIVAHPTDKNLSALVEKYKNQTASEWIIVATITDSKSKDSWKRTFYLRLGTPADTGVRTLQVFDVVFKNDRWYIDDSFAVESDASAYLYAWTDAFYDEFINGLANADSTSGNRQSVI